MWPMIFGLISAGLTALQGFNSSQAQISQAQNQARVMEANARVARQNAALEAEQANFEARQQDKKKSALRREYESVQAQNRVNLGAGNVEMFSGSALDVAEGNINNFASDMGDNAYAVAMKRWEAAERERQGKQSAHIMEENASWLKQSSGNIFTSLLTASIGGFGGFTQGYTTAGGSLGSLFGGKGSGQNTANKTG